MAKRLISDIMDPDPPTARPEESLAVAWQRMMASGRRRLPVVDDAGDICGILSDRDLRLAADSPLLEETPAEILDNLQSHTVEEIMTTAVHTIEADSPIVEAAQLMRVAQVGGLPVVEFDETGNREHLVGMVTRSHLLDFLIVLLEDDIGEEETDIEGTAETVEGQVEATDGAERPVFVVGPEGQASPVQPSEEEEP